LATEITGYLMISKSSSDSFIFNRNIDYILSLDEGHDRPCWEWVKKVNSKRNSSKAWVPEMPTTILRDGLLMALTEGLMDKAAISAIESRGSKRTDVVDLNHVPVPATTYEDFQSFFEGFEIAVIAFPGSTLLNQVSNFIEAGLAIKFFTERHLEIGE
jgi:hypothetical protein